MKTKHDSEHEPKRDLDIAQAKDLLALPNLFVLDVRTPREFQAGALKGAVLIPVDQLAQNIDRLPEEKDRPILVYCAHGVRSLTAQQILVQAGFSQVFNLRGGLAHFLGVP